MPKRDNKNSNSLHGYSVFVGKSSDQKFSQRKFYFRSSYFGSESDSN